jgi:hypothetical protein
LCSKVLSISVYSSSARIILKAILCRRILPQDDTTIGTTICIKKEQRRKRRKKLTLTIEGDVSDELEELPRRVSISEFVNFMLKGYVETFKKGHVLGKEEVDEIVAKMGGEEFRERIRNTFPTLDTAVAVAQWVKDAAGYISKEPKKA